jgi:hypothetical protein
MATITRNGTHNYDDYTYSTPTPSSGSFSSPSSGSMSLDDLPWPDSVKKAIDDNPMLEAAFEALPPEAQQELAGLVSLFSQVVDPGQGGGSSPSDYFDGTGSTTSYSPQDD